MILIIAILLHLIFFSAEEYGEYGVTYQQSIFNVAQNSLLQYCTLDDEFEISFDLYIKSGTYARNRNILSLVNNRNKVLIALDTRRKKKIRMKGLVGRKHVKVKFPLNKWNTFRIIQEKQGNKVCPILSMNIMKLAFEI